MAALLGGTAGRSAPPAAATTSVIVQAADAATASRIVAVGGTVTHELGIIRAAGARLTAAQRGRPAGMQGVLRLYEDGQVRVDDAGDQTLTVLDALNQDSLTGNDGRAGGFLRNG